MVLLTTLCDVVVIEPGDVYNLSAAKAFSIDDVYRQYQCIGTYTILTKSYCLCDNQSRLKMLHTCF